MSTIAGVAIALLQFSDELFCVALDLIQIVVGQLSPTMANITLQLMPLALDNV